MTEDRRRAPHECPACLKYGFLYRQGEKVICSQCGHQFVLKRGDDEQIYTSLEFNG